MNMRKIKRYLTLIAVVAFISAGSMACKSQKRTGPMGGQQPQQQPQQQQPNNNQYQGQ